jgi:hypothetical protein
LTIAALFALTMRRALAPAPGPGRVGAGVNSKMYLSPALEQ